MKKALTVFLTAILLTGLCACATDNDDNTLSAQEASYSGRLDELNSKKAELEQELSKISAEKGALSDEADKLKAKIEELDDTLSSFLEQLSAAKDENASLTQELSEQLEELERIKLSVYRQSTTKNPESP